MPRPQTQGTTANQDTNFRFTPNTALEALGTTLNFLDQFAAGFANTVTFGESNKWRESLYGELATQNHQGGVYNLGQFAGVGTTIALGFMTPNAFVSEAGWAKQYAQGYAVVSTGVGAFNSTQNISQGNATFWDALSFAPAFGFTASGVARELAQAQRLRQALYGARQAEAELARLANQSFNPGLNNLGNSLHPIFNTGEAGANSSTPWHSQRVDDIDGPMLSQGQDNFGEQNLDGLRDMLGKGFKINANNLRKFPNLYPEDFPKSVRRSLLENRDSKWVEVLPNGQVRSASGTYNFVTIDGKVYGAKVDTKVGAASIKHIDLAEGASIDYAGKVVFSGRHNRGIIRSWSNSSGHYKPDPTFANQAGFPLDLFQPIRFPSNP